MTTRTATSDAVRTALHGPEFPAGKDDLAWTAERNEADAATVEAPRAVPAEEHYASIADVVAAVDLADDDPARQTAGDTADESAEETEQLRTEHTRPGLSESTKDVDPVNRSPRSSAPTARSDPRGRGGHRPDRPVSRRRARPACSTRRTRRA
ncbi:DUF2795 domain-containing protein [Pseudonocardia sp. HH130629-09]|uniref:DUF2795 domain-containing protein n=1 Tax=Pseudonocardia sp. HH130629-09 TaxID=1641402 RepID=UPI0006CB3108|nr:DUF2795 domain-containing protein [Pseudonocardia sp. HH130629-09]ALE84558.1 hypothetical protein XF36_16645 [Pseudonocardia sp. HH130629-09]